MKEDYIHPITAFCDPKYDLSAENKLTKKYIILSSQRTGSTYICSRLSNIKNEFGMPDEYFNHDAFKALLPRLNKPETGQSENKLNLAEYLRFIRKIRTSEDGFFGMKAQPNQLLKIFGNNLNARNKFIESHDLIVVMTRRNKLQQSISTTIANMLNRWHSLDNEINFDDSQKKQAYQMITANIFRFFKEESFLRDVLKNSKKPTLHIEYEDIEKNPDATFEKVVKFLAGDENKKITNEENILPIPKKNSTNISQELESNYINYISGTIYN